MGKKSHNDIASELYISFPVVKPRLPALENNGAVHAAGLLHHFPAYDVEHGVGFHHELGFHGVRPPVFQGKVREMLQHVAPEQYVLPDKVPSPFPFAGTGSDFVQYGAFPKDKRLRCLERVVFCRVFKKLDETSFFLRIGLPVFPDFRKFGQAAEAREPVGRAKRIGDKDEVRCLEACRRNTQIVDYTVKHAVGGVSVDCSGYCVRQGAYTHGFVKRFRFPASDFAYDKGGIPKPQRSSQSLFGGHFSFNLRNNRTRFQPFYIITQFPELLYRQFQSIFKRNNSYFWHYLDHYRAEEAGFSGASRSADKHGPRAVYKEPYQPGGE